MRIRHNFGGRNFALAFDEPAFDKAEKKKKNRKRLDDAVLNDDKLPMMILALSNVVSELTQPPRPRVTPAEMVERIKVELDKFVDA